MSVRSTFWSQYRSVITDTGSSLSLCLSRNGDVLIFLRIAAAALWMFGGRSILRAVLLLPSATARLSLSFAFILCGAAGRVKESTRVIFIPGLGVIV